MWDGVAVADQLWLAKFSAEVAMLVPTQFRRHHLPRFRPLSHIPRYTKQSHYVTQSPCRLPIDCAEVLRNDSGGREVMSTCSNSQGENVS
jgi:hypothetical protein